MKKNIIKKVSSILYMTLFMAMLPVNASNKLMDSSIGQGIMNMLKDFGFAMMILGPAITVIITVILLIKKAASEGNEGDSRRYNKSILVTLGCGIATLLVGGIFSIIGSYFGVTMPV